MTCHYPDLGSASDWLKCKGISLQPIRSTTYIWVETRHQYGISALITSFCEGSSGDLARPWLFSQAIQSSALFFFKSSSSIFFWGPSKERLLVWGHMKKKFRAPGLQKPHFGTLTDKQSFQEYWRKKENIIIDFMTCNMFKENNLFKSVQSEKSVQCPMGVLIQRQI